MRQTINQTNSCRHLIIKRGNNLHAAFIWAIVHVFWHRCPFYGLKGGLHWLNDDGWWGGLVWWACWMVPWKDRQIHQQCSCPISGQGVLICSETSIQLAPTLFPNQSYAHCTAPVFGTGGENWKGLILFHTWLDLMFRTQDKAFNLPSTLHRFEWRNLQWCLKVPGESFI